MTTMTQEQIFTPEDLLALPDRDRFELLHGKLVERKTGVKSNWVGGRITMLLGIFLEAHPLGYVIPETNYVCFPDDPRHAPRPDVSFIRFGRSPGEKLPQGFCRIAPDLVVEVVSPNDTAEEVVDKVADFQSVGVPLIWVVYPNTRRVLIHRLRSSPEGRVSELTDADTINGEDVLPGFSCPVSTFFAMPSPAKE